MVLPPSIVKVPNGVSETAITLNGPEPFLIFTVIEASLAPVEVGRTKVTSKPVGLLVAETTSLVLSILNVMLIDKTQKQESNRITALLFNIFIINRVSNLKARDFYLNNKILIQVFMIFTKVDT